MNLVIDSGNTTIKLGLFKNGILEKVFTTNDYNQLARIISGFDIKRSIISSVRKDQDIIKEKVLFKVDPLLLSSGLQLPFNNNYETPQTLGSDRIAGVAGAYYLYPGKSSLVIDAGTCITYDFIDKEKNYYGGAISPGISIRFKALNAFTAGLPLVEKEENISFIGKSSKGSILSGVLNGAAVEIQGMIGEFKKNDDKLNVIMCGGDARFFERRLKETIFVVPDLVLIGLNSILEYNERFL